MMMKIMYITTTYSIAGRYHMIGLGGSAVKSENGNLLTIPGLLKKSLPELNLLLNDFSRIILELNCYQKL